MICHPWYYHVSDLQTGGMWHCMCISTLTYINWECAVHGLLRLGCMTCSMWRSPQVARVTNAISCFAGSCARPGPSVCSLPCGMQSAHHLSRPLFVWNIFDFNKEFGLELIRATHHWFPGLTDDEIWYTHYTEILQCNGLVVLPWM